MLVLIILAKTTLKKKDNETSPLDKILNDIKINEQKLANLSKNKEINYEKRKMLTNILDEYKSLSLSIFLC